MARNHKVDADAVLARVRERAATDDRNLTDVIRDAIADAFPEREGEGDDAARVAA